MGSPGQSLRICPENVTGVAYWQSSRESPEEGRREDGQDERGDEREEVAGEPSKHTSLYIAPTLSMMT